MNRLVTTDTGGFPIALDDIRWLDNAYREAMNYILLGFGNNFIVQGCLDQEDGSIGPGYVMLNGKLLKVDQHVPTGNSYQLVSTNDPAGLITFKNGVQRNIYLKERATVSGIDTALPRYGDRLNRLIVMNSMVGNDAGQIPYNGAELTPNKRVLTNELGNLIPDPSDLILRKIINIGSWDMSQYSGTGVDHGLTFAKILSVSAYINMDDFAKAYNILGMQSEAGAMVHGTISYDNESVYLAIPAGSNWVKDYGGFDDPNVNRGIIVIEYIP